MGRWRSPRRPGWPPIAYLQFFGVMCVAENKHPPLTRCWRELEALFMGGTETAALFQGFIECARRSRLGLHQDVGRTKKAAKFRELFSGRSISAFPSVVDYGRGEILLCRSMDYDGEVFFFGDPKGFPREAKAQIEDMVMNKLAYFFEEGKSVIEHYETFMKLAGPYWMSCVTKNEDVPILDPDHYRSYLDERS